MEKIILVAMQETVRKCIIEKYKKQGKKKERSATGCVS